MRANKSGVTLKISILTAFVASLILFGFACKQAKQQKPATSLLSFFSEKDFNQFFPQHSQFFTYAAFKKAIIEMGTVEVKIEKRGQWIYKITRTDKLSGVSTVVRQDADWDEDWAKKQEYSVVDLNYDNFCGDKNRALDKKEAAAFFAQIAHETRNGVDHKFNDGLMLKQEVDTSSSYVIPNKIYPAVKGASYYGRGPLQLSYNGNYGFASTCILGNKDILLNNPEQVSTDPVLAFKTALYFWMTPQGQKPSAHDVITGIWKPSAAELKSGYQPGFGMTINIINGAIECNKGEGQMAMKDRIGFYNYFLKLFSMEDKNGTCSCGKMMPFSS